MSIGRNLVKGVLVSGALGFGLLMSVHVPVQAQGKLAPPAPKWKVGNGPVDLKLTDPVLVGALDLHGHLNPDTSGGGQAERAWDTIDYARAAKAVGMRGFIHKTHMDITAAASAYMARKEVPGVEVFARYSMNLPSGGLNPSSVVEFASIKGGWGRIVEFPTRDSNLPKTENRPWVMPWASIVPTYPKTVPYTRDGALTPEAKQIIELVSKHKTMGSNGTMTIATGHASPENHVLIAREARRMGVQTLLTHPGDNVTDAQYLEMKKIGAFIEVNCDFYQEGGDPDEKVAWALRQIKLLGAESIVIGTDCGQLDNPVPTDCIALGAKALRQNGITERQMNIMFKENPAKYLGLPPPGTTPSAN